ncbi:MAG: putative signal transducing protein [Terriglobia bacterium]
MEETVRIWVGLNLLQAQMMKQALLDSGIDCFADRDLGVIPAGEFAEIGLWVGKQQEARARALLAEMEEKMSAQLERNFPEDNPEG